MFVPSVRFGLPDGSEVTLGPGALIGRLPTATLCWPDPSLSEARALVSVRGGELALLGLRGPLRSERHGRLQDVPLTEGDRITLSDLLWLQVRGLGLPERVPCLRCPDPVPLLLSVAALVADGGGRLHLVAGSRDDALARVWSGGATWFLQAPGASAIALEVGMEVSVGGRTLTVDTVLLRSIAGERTRLPAWAHPALTVTIGPDQTSVRAEDGRTVLFDGKAAVLLHFLNDIGGPVPWERFSRRLWRKNLQDPYERRQAQDSLIKLLDRMRGELASQGFRTDLVRSDGRGNYQLHVEPDDVVEVEAVQDD